MKDYSQSKIYKLVSPHTDKIYIGSTQLKYLSTRLASHRQAMKQYDENGKNSRYKFCSAFDILRKGDVCIELIEAYPCKSVDELNAKELQTIRNNLDKCVNIYGTEQKRDS